MSAVAFSRDTLRWCAQQRLNEAKIYNEWLLDELCHAGDLLLNGRVEAAWIALGGAAKLWDIMRRLRLDARQFVRAARVRERFGLS